MVYSLLSVKTEIKLTDTNAAWQRYQELRPGVIANNKEIYQLRRFGIGTLAKKRESARLGVERAGSVCMAKIPPKSSKRPKTWKR